MYSVLGRRVHLAPCFPSKSLHNPSFQFLLGITVFPREIKDNGYAFFFEGKGGGGGEGARCIMVYVKKVNNGIKQIPDEDYCLLLRLSLGKCKSSRYLLSLLNTLCDVPLTLCDL